MPPVLNVIAFAAFAANLSVRSLDPVLPQLAGDFNISIAQAAGLSAGFAFTFALVQPIVGAAADMFGKARLILICLVLLGVGNILGTFTSSYSLLLLTRILCGIGSGGLFPSAMCGVSDLVPAAQRQVALGRILSGAMAGNVLGASIAGVIGDVVGWRGVVLLIGGLTLVSGLACGLSLRKTAPAQLQQKPSLSALWQGYRAIFANPMTRICYGGVFMEGVCVFGIFPFVASFLFELGETRLSIAGVVIAGFALGGLFYSLSVSRLLPWLGVKGIMITGGVMIATQLGFMTVGASWQIQTISFMVMGMGFYMLHGSIQVFSSEISVEARASAMSLHACFFFLGQTVGAIACGFAIVQIGKAPTLWICAALMLLTSVVTAQLLTQPRPR